MYKVYINDQINESNKSSITTNRDGSGNDNNTPSDTYNNIVIFGDSVPKGINIRNLNTRLSTANCKCRFFGGATSKHFHHYIQLTLNETNVKIDIAVLHMSINDILKAGGSKDLTAESVIDIAKECVWFVVKDVFASSVMVNTRRASTCISAVNHILQDKCATNQFHFIDNSNVKKEYLWKDGLHQNRSGKDLLINNFLRSLNNFLRKIKRTRSCDIGLCATSSDEISCGSCTQKFNGANSKKEMKIDSSEGI